LTEELPPSLEQGVAEYSLAKQWGQCRALR
jgi:hypothetical protein